ncbi:MULTISPECIES: hypothetical protein [unclassified Pseudomonas]|uniref:hypothetical protein n=1 Tax=unclassified Pseudomonas TaxID=196821 RepID=UPI001113DCF0|nr:MULTISPECIES: hypothetical protein [unclassified Pseudomonas]
MNIKYLLGSILLMLSPTTTTAQEPEANLCTPNEIMIASCRLDEKKQRTVSFCSSADQKRVTYRIGTVSTMEMDVTFPEDSRLYRWVDRATYTVYFGFRVMKYAYIFGVPQETFGAKAFLDVTKQDKDLMSRTCTSNSFGEKMLDSAAIQEVSDDLVRGNGFLFPPR